MGYISDIRARHVRQRPRSTSQLTIGMLSYHAIAVPHCGQRERGATIEPPVGHRLMQTFKNEPMVAPNTKANAPIVNSIMPA
jgi:hypothetical protein